MASRTGGVDDDNSVDNAKRSDDDINASRGQSSAGAVADDGSNAQHVRTPAVAAEHKDGAPTNQAAATATPQPVQQPSAKGWRFWMVFPPLCIATLLAAMEATVTSTALPTITVRLHTGSEYPWYVNAYLLTNAVSIPFWGQFAFVFGRRYPAMVAVCIFLLGSGITGAANSSPTFIVGRTVQGIGGGGVTIMTQLIVSDIVSVRERGKHLGIIFGVFGLGLAIGPVIGGAIVDGNSGDAWRWVFWLNLPICAVTLLLQLLFLQVTYKKMFTFKQKMQQIDWVGNALLIGSVVSVLLALSWADTQYPWTDWRVLFTLIFGFAVNAIFHVWESTKWCKRPTISPKVFKNRTSSVVFILTFFQSTLTYWRIYILPIYFQSVLLVSPGRSGVLLLPTVITAVPTAILGGRLLTRWGKYRTIHIWGFGVTLLGTGLYINLDQHSSLAKIVLYQVVSSLGNGVLLTCILPAIQASLPQSEMAVATSTWGFLRAYGNIWGIAIPTAIFNSHIAGLLHTVPDPAVRATLSNGNAYSHIAGNYVRSLPPDVADAVVEIYNRSLRLVWIVCTAISGACFLLCFLEKQYEMRTTVKSDFGLKEKKKTGDLEKAADNPSPPSEK